jgi:glutamate-1-semialdehyde 2,1-aminomutase
MKSMRTTVSRRALLGAASVLRAAAQSRAVDVAGILQVNDLDRRIWAEELEEFVPKRIWDMHSHLGLYRFDTDPKRGQAPRYALNAAQLEKTATIDALEACNRLLYPGRTVTPFVLPNPYQHCDCVNLNEWAAEQAKQVPNAVCAMVVKPEMTADYVDKQIRAHRFIGFKPYMWYAKVANWREARLTDFLPEHQVEVANQYGLIMSVHLSKRAAISDPENLADLARLSRAYPRVRWMLLHNARSYAAWAMERAAPRLRDIPNVWLESSSVCEADAFHATFTLLGVNRFCYGSDDIPVGITRGKYIAWGYGWEQLDANKFPVKITHCDGRMTFVRYEMLRAIKRAARYAGLSKAHVDGIFHGNGDRLVSETQADLNRALGVI